MRQTLRGALAVAAILIVAGCQSGPTKSRHVSVADQLPRYSDGDTSLRYGEPPERPALVPGFAAAPPSYAGDVQALREPVTIGDELPSQTRHNYAIDVTIRQGDAIWPRWYSGRVVTHFKQEGEKVAMTATLADFQAVGPEDAAEMVRQLKGARVRLELDERREVRSLVLEKGPLNGPEGQKDQLQQVVSMMLEGFLKSVSGQYIRGTPIRQGDLVMDMATAQRLTGGVFNLTRVYASGQTTYLGRPSLLATVDMENLATGARASGYNVIDIETGFILAGAVSSAFQQIDGTVVESLDTFTVTEFR